MLVGIFVVLLTGIIAYNIVKSGGKSSSYDPQLAELDTATVDKVSIWPKGQETSFDVVKKDGRWSVVTNGKEFPADNASIMNMLAQLIDVKAQRVAATKKESWKKYEITDSAATRIKVANGGETVLDLYMGKFSFKKSQNPYQRQPDITSYIRRAGDDCVYAVSGMLGMSFNRKPEDLRNQVILQIDPEEIVSADIQLNGNSYSLEMKDSVWMVAGIPADSAKVAGYINGLRSVRHRNFADDVQTGSPVAKINVQTTNENYTVEAFDGGNGEFYLASSQNKDAVFVSDSTGPYQKLFKSPDYFIPVVE